MDKEEVKKLAKLARIEISDTEAEELKNDFQPILDYVGQVKGALPQTERIHSKPDFFNVMREDENPHRGDIYTEDLLNAAPKREGGYVKVKKIL